MSTPQKPDFTLSSAFIATRNPETGEYGKALPIDLIAPVHFETEQPVEVETEIVLPAAVSFESQADIVDTDLLELLRPIQPQVYVFDYGRVKIHVLYEGGDWTKLIIKHFFVDGREWWFDGKWFIPKDIIRRRFRTALRKKRNRG